MEKNQIKLEWDGKRPIIELINTLNYLKDKGYAELELITEKEELDLDTENGDFDYIHQPKLRITK